MRFPSWLDLRLHLAPCQSTAKLRAVRGERPWRPLVRHPFRRGWKQPISILSALVVVLLLLSSATIGIVVHLVAPRAGAGDLLSLLNASDPAPGSLAWRIRTNQRINILLLAKGGSGPDNPDFTDTMVVVSIRPQPLALTAISIPRYLWAAIPAPVTGQVEGKLYSAYALGAAQDRSFLRPEWLTPTGAGDLAAATVGETIGQHIDCWIAVEPEAFEGLVDIVGGVRLTVPVALDDWRYPAGDTDQTIHVHFDAGTQVMDGRRALEYARSRLSTSEADRSRRQESILVALIQSLRTFHPAPLSILSLPSVAAGLRTDMTPTDIRDLAQLTSRVDTRAIKRITLEDSDLLQLETVGQADILVPRSGSYSELQAFVASQLP